ncbi:hypothetical protein E6O75_ATG05975 [Venturia nashicola]|uniref:Uncharacterized protein n=1 Tax=Venturia nashicola TaxID=86259 RepID=A0A4Z1NV69_9PEZI|nr:hypothetical protein E6O75_ATG05975 [Venturia nashicola]
MTTEKLWIDGGKRGISSASTKFLCSWIQPAEAGVNYVEQYNFPLFRLMGTILQKCKIAAKGKEKVEHGQAGRCDLTGGLRECSHLDVDRSSREDFFVLDVVVISAGSWTNW